MRKLKDGETYKCYYEDEFEVSYAENDGNNVTVDEDGFIHSYDDKPGFESNVVKEWYNHGRVNRINGYAIYYKHEENNPHSYYIDGVIYYDLKKWEEKAHIERNREEILNQI